MSWQTIRDGIRNDEILIPMPGHGNQNSVRLTARSIWLAVGAAATLLAVIVYLGSQRSNVAGYDGAPSALTTPPALPSVGLPDEGPEQQLLAIAPETARELNAARPFSTARLVTARPFLSGLSGEDRERAVTCLAIAALYEAGGKAEDQLPVMQVVLNRVRHPAWPNSVCAVVFQGSERTTGCQFSFTCDGSLQRWRPSAAALTAARQRAESMLGGATDKRVGLATHYHTNWVLPYWSASLEKVAAVDTHLFFRWNGYWGTRVAFRSPPAVLEPQIQDLAVFSAAHLPTEKLAADAKDGQLANMEENSGAGLLEPGAAIGSGGAASQDHVFRITLSAQTEPGRWALDALKMCANRPECRVVGWTDGQIASKPLTSEVLIGNIPDFIYVQELRNRVREAYWNCRRWPKAPSTRCINSGNHAAEIAL